MRSGRQAVTGLVHSLSLPPGSWRIANSNILICTPGRLLQHMDETPNFHCTNIKILVLDEADKILELGFQHTVNAILDNLPKDRQTLLFSATQTRSVSDLARVSLHQPVFVSVHEHAKYTTPDKLRQSYVVCKEEDKINLLWSFIRHHTKSKVLVFLASCKQVKYMYESFCHLRPGVPLLALHGMMHQLKRMEVYDAFCRKQRAVLFATDIAARGLDIPGVHWVIQVDCPEDTNTYIHRAGRTARHDGEGEALLLLRPSEERPMVAQLQDRNIPISKIDINPSKQFSITKKLEALCAEDVSLKEKAQRCVVAYVKSIFLMKDKTVFDVNQLNLEQYAQSLGLATCPRVRFVNKRKRGRQSKMDSADVSESSDDTRIKEGIGGSAVEEDDLLFVKKPSSSFLSTERREDQLDLEQLEALERKKPAATSQRPTTYDALYKDTIENLKTSHKRIDRVNKVTVAKKLLKRNLQLNTKTKFTDDADEVMIKEHHPALISEVEEDEELVVESLDMKSAHSLMRARDVEDKKTWREKIRLKHLQEKKKFRESESEDNESDTNTSEDVAESYGIKADDDDDDHNNSIAQNTRKEDKQENEKGESCKVSKLAMKNKKRKESDMVHKNVIKKKKKAASEMTTYVDGVGNNELAEQEALALTLLNTQT